METVTSADGTTIAYERTGQGPPLVLVHGSAGDRTRWELFGVRAALAEHCTVHAMDRRGRGGSGDAEGYALQREVEDVVAVVADVVAAAGEPAVLLGHSFGALCCLEAARSTDGLRGLVLYEPAFPVAGHALTDAKVLAGMEALLEEGEDEEALLLFFRELVQLPDAEVEALRAAPSWPARVAAAYTLPRESRAEEGYALDPDRFAGMTTPTLLLSGSDSAPVLGAATEAVAAALPECRTVVFEGHGHTAMNTAPERFVEVVVAFVQARTGAGGPPAHPGHRPR